MGAGVSFPARAVTHVNTTAMSAPTRMLRVLPQLCNLGFNETTTVDTLFVPQSDGSRFCARASLRLQPSKLFDCLHDRLHLLDHRIHLVLFEVHLLGEF